MRMIKQMKIPFHRPFIDDNEIDAVSNVLRSGWLTMGGKTFDFEAMFASKVSARHAIAFNSATSALHIALALHDIKPGDEVIVPAVTFVATAETVRYFGAVPVFADVERDTHNISVESVKNLINNKTKGIIPVHYSGLPADMDSLFEICRNNGLFLIEDSAHAFPSFYKGKSIGSFESPSVFSFYANKTITTGEGGMLTLSDDAMAEKARKMRLHGIDRDAWKRYSHDGSWMYDVTELGYKYNPTDISSAIGIEQLKKSNDMTLLRKNICRRYDELFSSSESIEVYPSKEGRESSNYIYPVKLKLESLSVSRDYVIEELKKSGISASMHFIPLYRFSYYKDLYHSMGRKTDFDNYPNSEYIFEREITLPLYPSMTDEEVEYVAENLIRILSENIK